MILESIKIQNIRSYVDEEIKFPKGSTLLAGDIGTGKSTILLAIEFALFGTAKGQLSGDSLLRKGSSEGSVELTFRLNGEQVTIKRALKRRNETISQTAGHIINRGTKKEGTAVELKAQMLNLLGYPKDMLTKKNDLYRYTVYTPQEAMKHILYDSAEQRQDTLRRIFGIDKYKNIRENTIVFLRFLKEKQKELEIRLETLQDNKELKNKLDVDCNRIKKELELNSEEQDKLQKELREVRKELKDVEKKTKKLQDYKKEFNMQEDILKEKLQQITKNREGIIEIESKIKELEEKKSNTIVEELKKEDREIEKEIFQIQKEIDVFKQEKNRVEEKLNHLEEEEVRLKKEIQTKNEQTLGILDKRAEMLAIEQELKNNLGVKTKLEEESKNLQELILGLSKLKTEEEQSRKIIKDVKNLEHCPQCRQEVNEGHRTKILDEENLKLNEVENRIIKLDSLKREKQKTIDDLNKKINLVEEKEKEKLTVGADIKRQEEIVEEIVKLRTQLSEVSQKIKDGYDSKMGESKLKSHEDKLIKLNLELKNVQKQKLMQKEKQHLGELIKEKSKTKNKLEDSNQETKKQIGSINLKKKELQENIDSMKEIEQEYLKIEGKEKQKEEKEKQLEAQKASMKKELMLLEEQLNRLHVEILNQEKHKKEKMRFMKIQDWLSSNFNPLTTVIEKHVMTHIHKEFDNSFKQWFDILVDDDNLSIRLDEEFSPVIIQNSYETDVENLSGGEKTSAALAYRLALNKVINHAIETIRTKDLIILDEPTDGFSMEQLDNVRNVLDELSLNQIIIVSHENKIESFVDNIIRVGKEDHISRVLS